MGMAQIAIVDGTYVAVGKGAVFFDRFSTAGAKQGSVFMGNVPKLEIAPNVELIDKRTSVDASNAIIASVERARSMDVNLDFSERRKENLGLALFGEVGEYTQTATPVVGEQLSASSLLGRTYWTAKRKLTAYTVKDDAVAKTEGTDYEIDTETGAVYIKPGGAIADGSIITIDYTPTAITAGAGLTRVRIGTAGSIYGELRFVGNPAAGKIEEVILWKVQISASAALQYIAEEFSDASLTGRLIADYVGHNAEPYGVHYIR